MPTRILSTLLAMATLAAPLAAQTASLARDINPGSAIPSSGSRVGPLEVSRSGERALFLTQGGDVASPSYQLWATDGTDTGTEILTTLCAGFTCQAPKFVAQALGLAFFLAPNSDITDYLYRLWRTDGTRAGTFPVSTPITGAYGSVEFAGKLYFFGCDFSVCGLWRSDGTAAGTALWREGMREAAVLGDRLFFLGPGPQGSDPSLWISDGTDAGTKRLQTLPGGGRLLTAAGSRLFFMAGALGDQLWTSDGTRAGTTLVQQFSEHGDEDYPPFTNFLKPLGGDRIAFFAAQGPFFSPDLWTSDGTRRGTRPLTHFQNYGISDRADQIAPLPGGRLLFVARPNNTGSRLWVSQGNAAATAPVTGCPEGCPALQPYTPLVSLGDRVLFSAQDPHRGTELWTSDGTGPGTRLLLDLCPGSCSSEPTAFTRIGGKVYFSTDFGDRAELWRTDGTAAGTERLAGLPDAAPPLRLASVGGRVFFTGFDPVHGAQPWMTDGTPAGTSLVTVLASPGASSNPRNLSALGGQLLFTADDGDGRSFWKSRGTPATTVPLPGTGVSDTASSVVAGGLGYFVRENGETGSTLWRTDGTAAGTYPLIGFADRKVGPLFEVAGRPLFLVASSVGEKPVYSFWTSDGTPAGTVKRLDLPEDTVGVRDFVPLGDQLLFIAGLEEQIFVYRSDGTAAGTRPILEFACPICVDPYNPMQAARVGNLVYFTAFGKGTNGSTLWESDGTLSGSRPVLPDASVPNAKIAWPAWPFEFGGDLYFFAIDPATGQRRLYRGRGLDATPLGVESPEIYGPDPEFTPVGGTLYFRGHDADHGVELWRTDGTPAGTFRVRDLAPGPASSDPQQLTAAGGRLFFTARNSRHGRELWTSDGTEAGTRLVQDLAPESNSSNPQELTVAGDRLYFSADDGLAGRELWSVPLASPGCQPSDTRLCLSGLQVEAFWRLGQGELRQALAHPLTPNTGLFSFADAAHPDLAVKALDGRAVNGHHWVFYGALSDLEITLTVTDPATGAVRRYFKPAGRFGSVGDTLAFGPQGANGASTTEGPAPVLSEARAAVREGVSAGSCTPSPRRLCLLEGRFAVEMQGAEASPIPGMDSGFFWLFAPDLPEVIVKVLDGRAVNGHVWIFLVGLTDQPFTVTVTDTETGTSRTYRNSAGGFLSAGDTAAF